MCLIVTCFSKRVTIVINDDNVKQSITIPEVKDSVRNVVKYVKPENKIPLNWDVDTARILINKLNSVSEFPENVKIVYTTIALINTNGGRNIPLDNNIMNNICYDENCNVTNHCSLRNGQGKTFFKKFKTFKDCLKDFDKECLENKIFIGNDYETYFNKMDTELMITKKTFNNYKIVLKWLTTQKI
jgi:hypothetical protein